MKELISKEEHLLENDVRNQAARLAEMIDDNCLEFSTSGKQNLYRSGAIFEMNDGVSYIDSNTVKFIDLADNCKLLLYVAVKVNKNVRMKSNRSSVWKKIGSSWKIVFHQGTNCTE